MSLSSHSSVMFRHPIKIMVQVMFFKFCAKKALHLLCVWQSLVCFPKNLGCYFNRVMISDS